MPENNNGGKRGSMTANAARANAAGTGRRGKAAIILDAARALFLTQGYGVTSMDGLARRAGVSKATLYAHFAGKEALFAALVSAECARLEAEIATLSASRVPVNESLPRLAAQFLELLMSPWALAIHRIVVAEAPRFPELGRAFHRAGPAVMKARLEIYLRQAVARGELRLADPTAATGQLMGMIRGDLQLRCLLDPANPPSPVEIERQAAAAAETFLAAFAPRPG